VLYSHRTPNVNRCGRQARTGDSVSYRRSIVSGVRGRSARGHAQLPPNHLEDVLCDGLNDLRDDRVAELPVRLGTGIIGGASSVVRIPKTAFRPLDAANLAGL
jgi:hypothetical protein